MLEAKISSLVYTVVEPMFFKNMCARLLDIAYQKLVISQVYFNFYVLSYIYLN